MRALVAYGTARGSTGTIARWLAEWLKHHGVDVDLAPAGEAPDPAPYDAVIVGGAVYMNRWHADARHFVANNGEALHGKPVWFFSSGPLDDTALRTEIPPTPDVAELMQEIGARGHRTFGGHLAPRPQGFLARLMARRRAGDWRNPARVQQWGTEIARAMRESYDERTSPSARAEHGPGPSLH